MSNKVANLILPYYKQGNDLHECIVHNVDGTMNVKESFKRHIGLLQAAINRLQSIHDAIPDENTCELHADTHYICIFGDDSVVQKLVNEGLASLEESDIEYSADEPDVNEVDAHSIEKLPKSDNSWVTDWQRTCAEYEQSYIDAFGQNPKNKN